MSKGSILFIFTSADKVLDGKETGWYLPEAAHPYYVLHNDFNIEAASTKGGAVPLDENSKKMFTDEESVRFLSDPKAQELVKNTKKIGDVKADDYVAIFVVGGHGPLIDLAPSKEFASLVEDFYNSKKVVSAVCHGPAALIGAKKNGTDESIFNGIEATVFTNSEEAQTPYNDFVNTLPFSPEDKLKELGAKFVKTEDWGVKVVYDGGVLTGQNPASAGPLGKKLKEILLSA
ncbi:uncharacterized protein I303_100654 [Kwoniella dejecticola CBS 10117]|uniref:D-lactate dehydratase n=1 Tax=Kwoniella dejecticola CBS 10117 TaxID=1296121 RepID=A0A1A6AFK6_9TREE|nr:uncharacterized protein I303_00658 [Kwoniella dejecticola CBS 10117]OBR88841.1 hypothetical protein I303_00658 [Kwoniella dejecticola CBS 10117]